MTQHFRTCHSPTITTTITTLGSCNPVVGQLRDFFVVLRHFAHPTLVGCCRVVLSGCSGHSRAWMAKTLQGSQPTNMVLYNKLAHKHGQRITAVGRLPRRQTTSRKTDPNNVFRMFPTWCFEAAILRRKCGNFVDEARVCDNAEHDLLRDARERPEILSVF